MLQKRVRTADHKIIMNTMTTISGGNDDPRKLRDMLGRAASLASAHSLKSVVVGITAPESDLVFPQVIDFIESALRVEDVVFRMTRDRAVVFLADVDSAQAKKILDRVLADFCVHVAVSETPGLNFGFYEVSPGIQELRVKEVLPEIFW
ncbi:MAG: hypothetical protein GY772_13105 [bacterium]|nr:hypothetical protein [Deltaproteobacteria bacterium]MCP4241492.1 hypothetical protein [bacterium]MDP6074148.1 hypothetical protein [Myxococcota bacterium]MDP6241781.1 hypothetical protein [Myxococcota bacterium]MDP7299445.1 hypothetical protein [Myxococcota bacterium]